jgi:hypothetical protein
LKKGRTISVSELLFQLGFSLRRIMAYAGRDDLILWNALSLSLLQYPNNVSSRLSSDLTGTAPTFGKGLYKKSKAQNIQIKTPIRWDNSSTPLFFQSGFSRRFSNQKN